MAGVSSFRGNGERIGRKRRAPLNTHCWLAGEVDLAWLCAAINTARAARWGMRGQDCGISIVMFLMCLFFHSNGSNGEFCAIPNIESKPLKELGGDVRADRASSSLSHKNRLASLCSACNELMMRGDDRGGGAHFKFHADQRATSPVSHNQHDLAGRNKQTLTELFFFPPFSSCGTPERGGVSSQRAIFICLIAGFNLAARIVHHY